MKNSSPRPMQTAPLSFTSDFLELTVNRQDSLCVSLYKAYNCSTETMFIVKQMMRQKASRTRDIRSNDGGQSFPRCGRPMSDRRRAGRTADPRICSEVLTPPRWTSRIPPVAGQIKTFIFIVSYDHVPFENMI